MYYRGEEPELTGAALAGGRLTKTLSVAPKLDSLRTGLCMKSCSSSKLFACLKFKKFSL